MNVEEEPDDEPWYHDVKKKAYPSCASATTSRVIQHLVYQFFRSGHVLYKRSYGNDIISEVYEGACGSPMSR